MLLDRKLYILAVTDVAPTKVDRTDYKTTQLLHFSHVPLECSPRSLNVGRRGTQKGRNHGSPFRANTVWDESYLGSDARDNVRHQMRPTWQSVHAS